jgi:imidazoleglycerol phosphate dehydratase HisB
MVEACFKATGRALRQAIARTPRDGAVPSTKGSL